MAGGEAPRSERSADERQADAPAAQDAPAAEIAAAAPDAAGAEHADAGALDPRARALLARAQAAGPAGGLEATERQRVAIFGRVLSHGDASTSAHYLGGAMGAAESASLSERGRSRG